MAPFAPRAGKLSMEHVLAEHGLCLTYLCDPHSLDDLDQDRILDDLSEDADGDPLPWLTRYRMTDYDHLVTVADRASGRHLAFLGAIDGTTTRRENFLLLETAFVAPVARGQNLTQRMIALAILRIGSLRGVPAAIAACTRNPI